MSQNLKEYLELCKKEYYAGNPIISDSQYDYLEQLVEDQLNIGTEPGKLKHWYKMYSLKKYYVGEDFPEDGIYYITPKIDGSAIALRYVAGQLHSAATRGDGEFGEDITHLFTKVNCEKLGIPFKINHIGIAQITGEVAAKSEIVNARNYAAGALNLKSDVEFGTRELTFFAYDIQKVLLDSYKQRLAYLKVAGFSYTVEDEYTKYFPQDGVVYRIDSQKAYDRLGFTSKHPRGAFAVKERTEGVETTLLDVEWQTGKTGKVTPVAILEPVVIDGAKVSRATLNNVGFIQALDLYIGDKVMVERAGGIIPRIICKVDQQKNNS